MKEKNVDFFSIQLQCVFMIQPFFNVFISKGLFAIDIHVIKRYAPNLQKVFARIWEVYGLTKSQCHTFHSEFISIIFRGLFVYTWSG